MEQIILKLQEWIALYGLKVIAAVAILIIGRLAAAGVRSIVRRLLLKSRVDSTLVSFITVFLCSCNGLYYHCCAGTARCADRIFCCGAWRCGSCRRPRLTGSLANFAAGVLMIIFKPFKVDDFIEGGGNSGVVEEIGIFTTELRSPDNKKIIVPNAKMTGDNIVNYTVKDSRRVDIVAGVSYGDDLDKVKKVLNDILAGDDRILKDPAPSIGVLELADSNVNFAVRPWVKTEDYSDMFFFPSRKISRSGLTQRA